MYTSARSNSQVSSLACRAIDRNGLTNPNSQDSNVFRFLSHQIDIIDINPEEKKVAKSSGVTALVFLGLQLTLESRFLFIKNY